MTAESKRSVVSGGECAIYAPIGMSSPHISTGPDIEVSRRVAVHICDDCRCLFVPSEPEARRRVREA